MEEKIRVGDLCKLITDETESSEEALKVRVLHLPSGSGDLIQVEFIESSYSST